MYTKSYTKSYTNTCIFDYVPHQVPPCDERGA